MHGITDRELRQLVYTLTETRFSLITMRPNVKHRNDVFQAGFAFVNFLLPTLIITIFILRDTSVSDTVCSRHAGTCYVLSLK